VQNILKRVVNSGSLMHIPPGTSGFCVGLGIYVLVRFIADVRTPQSGKFTFEPNGVPGSFEPRLG